MILMRKQLLFLILICSCSFKTTTTKYLSWEYLNCLEDKTHIITYSYNPNEIKIPIFNKPLPVKILDSLCNLLCINYKEQIYNNQKVELDRFGDFYYTDSIISLAVLEAHLINNTELSFKCYVGLSNEGINSLSEHNSVQMIYVPKIGIVYAMLPDSDNPKIARMVKHYLYSKTKWDKKIDEIMQSYVVLNCR